MTYKEVEKYAESHGLVLWSKEMSDEAIEALKLSAKIEEYKKRLEKNGQYGTLRKLQYAIGEE